ncbi:MAG TPA: MBL fold metallo-hydrolase, partial [Tepidisphaeraceae bacterium]|nr:MBL fold metallo-hydrolase [Tepidisphaeraceae bacterium]
LARLPWSDVPLPAPPIWIVVIYFMLLPMAIYRWPRPGLRIGARSSLAGCLLLMFILPFSLGASPAPRLDPVMRITLLAVGAGQCAIVQPPGGRVFVIDAGSNTLSDPLRRAIAPALRERGITSIDTLLITHANYDHFSAAGELAEAYGVREVLVAPRFRAHAGTTTPGALLVASLDAADRPPREVQAGQVIPIAREARIEVLHPSADDRLEPNDSSLVIRLSFGQASVLMTGDIQERGIAALLAREDAALPADVLVAPHHGSIENNTADLLARVRPRLILSSNDRRLTLRQRDFGVLAGTTPLLRTHTSGAITLELRADGRIDVTEHLRPADRLVLPSRN